LGECSVEHIAMADTCPTLQKANDFRRRAWHELQRLRHLLALVVDDLPPAAKPASFEAEGALLRAALAKAIAEPWRRLAELEAAVEGIKPYLSNTLNDGTYPWSSLTSTAPCTERGRRQLGLGRFDVASDYSIGGPLQRFNEYFEKFGIQAGLEKTNICRTGTLD
jgi:hypothetical protein